jgi:hypothetical protein
VLPFAAAWHDALAGLLQRTGKETATRDEWFADGVRLNLTEAIEADDTKQERDRKRGKFANAKSDLAAAGWIKADGDVFRDATGSLADLVA